VTVHAGGHFPRLPISSAGSRTVISLRYGLDFAAAPALRERLINVLACLPPLSASR
jgi:hypothetical protein